MNNVHNISILVRNQPGVMAHVTGLFSRRGYNIESIAVGVTNDRKVSIITIMVEGEDRVIEQVTGQLFKLADVIEVRDMPYHESITRELALITVKVRPDQRTEVMGIIEVFGGKIEDMTEDTILVEVAGNSRQVKAIIELLSKYGIVDIARTGQIALPYLSNE